MLFIAVLAEQPPKPDDVWAILAQNPELATVAKEWLTLDCKMNVSVRTSAPCEKPGLHPYMFCMRVVKNNEELNYPDLTCVVMRNATTERQEEAHTKQVMKFMQRTIETVLFDFLGDLEFDVMDQWITSTGNGVVVLRNIELHELEDAFFRSNRANFQIVEGSKS